jgi:hypothetical protein
MPCKKCTEKGTKCVRPDGEEVAKEIGRRGAARTQPRPLTPQPESLPSSTPSPSLAQPTPSPTLSASSKRGNEIKDEEQDEQVVTSEVPGQQVSGPKKKGRAKKVKTEQPVAENINETKPDGLRKPEIWCEVSFLLHSAFFTLTYDFHRRDKSFARA